MADNGDGRYAFIDGPDEARREFVTELGCNLVPVAKDLKVRVDLNSDVVSSYRLIGYENRLMNEDEFEDERKDSGDVNIDHSVTALYEIDLQNVQGDLGIITLRYKDPVTLEDREIAVSMERNCMVRSYKDLSSDFLFTSSVAELAEYLQDSDQCDIELDLIIDAVEDALDRMVFIYPEEMEFLDLLYMIKDIEEGERE